MSAQKHTTTAAFHLAMQNVIKIGMKRTAFKVSLTQKISCARELSLFQGTRGYIMDVGEQELLESEPRLADIPADRVPPLPLEDLFLDQGEGVAESSQQVSPLFETLSCPQLDDRLIPLSPTATVELLLDTDSDSEGDLIEMDEFPLIPTIGGEEFAIDLDEPDEGEPDEGIPGRFFVDRFAKFSGQSRGLPAPSPHHLESSSGINYSSPLRTKAGFYVGNTPASTPQAANNGQDSVHRSRQSSKMEGHIVQQARSGDTGTSRSKGNIDHMAYLEEWRAQVAPNDMLDVPARAPPYLNLADLSESLDEEDELLLDTDSDLEGYTSRWTLRPEEPGSISLKEHELIVNPSPNAYNHTCHQVEFLDVLSEELYLGDEREMGSHYYHSGIPMNSITERNMITESITQGIDTKTPGREEVVSEVVFDELMSMDEGMELGASCIGDHSAERGDITHRQWREIG